MSRGRVKFTVNATQQVTNRAPKRRTTYRTGFTSPIAAPRARERLTVAASRSLSAFLPASRCERRERVCLTLLLLVHVHVRQHRTFLVRRAPVVVGVRSRSEERRVGK